MAPQEQFRSNIIMWIAMLSGMLMIAFIMIFLLSDKEGGFMMPMKYEVGLFFYVGLAAMAGAIVLSNYMYMKKMHEIKSLQSLNEKLEHYRASFILRAAFLEGACLINIIFMFLENNLLFFIIVAVGIFYFLKARPSPEQFNANYNLSSEERKAVGL